MKQAEQILNKPQPVAGRTLNTSSISRKIGVASAEVTTEVAALLGTSRAVNILFGEKHEELSSNEIAHTLAIVLGMKGFHGLVTIKDAKKGIVENEGKEYNFETDFTKQKGEYTETPMEKQDAKKNKKKAIKEENIEDIPFVEVHESREKEFADPSSNTENTRSTETAQVLLQNKKSETKPEMESTNPQRSEAEQKANELLKNIEKTPEKYPEKEQILESKLKEPEKIKTEQEAVDVLNSLEKEINNKKIPDAKAENILEKLTERYRKLSESMKKSPSILEKIKSLINTLIAKIGISKQTQTLTKMQTGEFKMPKNIENLPKKDLDMVMQANLMQENLPKFKKVAEFLDGGFVGKEWLISSLGFIPLLGNIGVT